jgi:hypothetical protein
MPNSNGTGGVIYSTFDGQPVSTTDVLVKYTYYGDANLDGVVDGSDYSLIDNGFLTHATGWFNGDFNYDGVIDGSDYTLIDNAFDRQGASVAWEPASTTALIAVNAGDTDVPEPPGFFLLVVAYAAMLRLERTNALQAALDP